MQQEKGEEKPSLKPSPRKTTGTFSRKHRSKQELLVWRTSFWENESLNVFHWLRSGLWNFQTASALKLTKLCSFGESLVPEKHSEERGVLHRAQALATVAVAKLRGMLRRHGWTLITSVTTGLSEIQPTDAACNFYVVWEMDHHHGKYEQIQPTDEVCNFYVVWEMDHHNSKYEQRIPLAPNFCFIAKFWMTRKGNFLCCMEPGRSESTSLVHHSLVKHGFTRPSVYLTLIFTSAKLQC